jgi:hypothetical protein
LPEKKTAATPDQGANRTTTAGPTQAQTKKGDVIDIKENLFKIKENELKA